MKLKINLDKIKTLNPCKDRLDNYVYYYEHRNFTLRQFLSLNNITHADKLWVVLRIIDDDTKVYFALDCSFSAYAASYAASDAAYVADADAAYASYVADAVYAACAVYAAYVADADAAYAKKAEEKRQIQALIYLIEGV